MEHTMLLEVTERRDWGRIAPWPRTPAGVAEEAALDRHLAGQRLRSAEFWRSLVAEHGLHVSEGPLVPGPADAWLCEPRAGASARARADMAGQGYMGWPQLVRADRCAALARGVVALCQQGWDAGFIGLVDEVWQLAFHLATVMGGVLEPAMMFRRELFAFCVDPTLAAGRPRGVPAHRDRPDSGYSRVDGLALPRHCTCWLSLTDATEANGCMYVVPTHADDEAALAVAPYESERGHALPTTPGTLLAWSGQAVHWGGRHDRARARGPRIAMAFSMTHPQVPSIGGFAPVRADTLPDLAERRSLVATVIPWLEPPAPGSALEVVFGLLGGAR
jgi:Phytanoyl-CoA dioxygenase (PhyH)